MNRFEIADWFALEGLKSEATTEDKDIALKIIHYQLKKMEVKNDSS